VVLTAHLTPGHTLGSTTWAWKSCENGRCLDIVYADSLTAVSSETFRFTDRPDRVEEFRRSIDRVAGLPCDILLTPHPEVFQKEEKLKERLLNPQVNPFIETRPCIDFAAARRRALESRVASETKGPGASR
jgi:metallo-beta-lactamase class B